MLNQIQQEILTGLMLGDGHLALHGNAKNAQLEIQRATKDKNYILYHKDIFSEFMTNKGFYERNVLDKRTNKTYGSVRLRTRALPEFTAYHDIWYKNNIKIIPTTLQLTPLTIATWIADDGSLYYHSKYGKIFYNEIRLQIATDGFSFDEVTKLSNILSVIYDIRVPVYKKYNSETNYYIMITKQADVRKILNSIDLVFPPGMERKSNIWRK